MSGYALNKRASGRTEHVKTRPCASRSLSVTAISPLAEKIVFALLDYPEAYDRIERKDMLNRTIDKGLPIRYAQWLCNFLSSRRAKVHINGE